MENLKKLAFFTRQILICYPKLQEEFYDLDKRLCFDLTDCDLKELLIVFTRIIEIHTPIKIKERG